MSTSYLDLFTLSSPLGKKRFSFDSAFSCVIIGQGRTKGCPFCSLLKQKEFHIIIFRTVCHVSYWFAASNNKKLQNFMAYKWSSNVSLYLMVGCIKYQFNKSISGYDTCHHLHMTNTRLKLISITFSIEPQTNWYQHETLNANL